MLLPGPDTRVVELRVHGIMGTRPEHLVSAITAVDVAGDGVGRFVRPADRLLRPAPGPVLAAGGRSIPRVVEGYVWSGMTSGGAAKATWALLFPFSLANMAHWMLPPLPRGHRLAARLGLAGRSLLRLAALLLTMLLVTQVAVVSLDLLAAQCLAPGSACLANTVPAWLRETYLVRPAIGLLPVLAVIMILHRVSSVAWETADAPNPPPSPPNLSVDLPGTNLAADPDTPMLRALHLLAALATVALLPVGGPFHMPGRPVDAVLWAMALVLLGLAMLAVLLLDDPTGAAPERMGSWLRSGLGPWSRRVLIGFGIALVLAVGAVQNPMPDTITGTDSTVEALAAALIGLVVLLGLLLIPGALIARAGWRSQPRELRPWAGGWMSAPMVAMAALLGGGFGAGLAITVRGLLGTQDLELPKGYTPVTLLWGASAVIAAAVAVPVAVVAAVHGWRSARAGGRFAEVGLLHRTRPADLRAAQRGWRRAHWQHQHLHHAVLAVAAILCAGAVISLYRRISGMDPPAWTTPLAGLGVLVLGALVAALLRAVYNAARAPEAGRNLGLIADLACFWPREAHPIVPPCYALKVIPELAARTVEHLREPGTRVVLTGNSQGSVLVVVAATRLLNSLDEPDRRRIGIVTAGAPLQWAYPRAFPGVVPHTALAALAGELGTRWRSLCRGTDAIGGPVTTWRRQVVDGQLLGVGFRPDGTAGPLPAAYRAPDGALVLGLDHWLPDPQLGPSAGRRWTPGVQGHGDYTADPEWDRAIALAAGLDPERRRPPGAALPIPRGNSTSEV
ncbi:hypothetical protein [Actinophytocola sp.]|uniref:hypothetical protein n=1 Tax=Actinophytocola sp. TaxID=1872138 RepID=UPI002D80A1A5|nr:hypothetical protein [Actinophytocola sp.]HET9142788.1 hypothetical protein [Actinophytocola sp.]